MILSMLTIGTGSLADPLGSSPLLNAVSWLEGTLLGTIATSIAVVSVAGTGMMMLSGRLPIRRGVTVVIGCFILFGASTIAAGIRAVAGDIGDTEGRPVAAAQPAMPSNATPTRPSPPPGYDPYAGAAVPTR